MRGRPHSRELKLLIVRQLASGEKRPAQVCREHNLAASMVARWRQEYDARGEAAFAPQEPTPTQALEAKVAELERFCGQ
jgi:putative transposase